jgi:hypothetical protein
MGYTWLPNLSMYSLAVIRPWRVIMGPTECCTTILLPRPSQTPPPPGLLLKPGILDCQLPWMFPKCKLSWCRGQCEGQLIWPYHAHVSSCLMSRFLVMTPLFMHLSVIRGLAIAALLWMLDLWSSHQTVFVETGSSKMNTQFCCHLCCSSSMIPFNQSFSKYNNIFLSVFIFTHSYFSLMFSSHDSCMLT